MSVDAIRAEMARHERALLSALGEPYSDELAQLVEHELQRHELAMRALLEA